MLPKMIIIKLKDNKKASHRKRFARTMVQTILGSVVLSINDLE